jgi:hypothetical protein
MMFPGEEAKALAAALNGVECVDEDDRIPADAKEKGLVVVYGASDDLVEFRGAIEDEVDCYEGGTIYLSPSGILDEFKFSCGCEFAEQAKELAVRNAKTIEALWCREEGYSWTYRTEIPHATFDVVEEGEKYCRGCLGVERNAGAGATIGL